MSGKHRALMNNLLEFVKTQENKVFSLACRSEQSWRDTRNEIIALLGSNNIVSVRIQDEQCYIETWAGNVIILSYLTGEHACSTN